MNIPLKELNTVLDAFKQGYRDAYHRGVFNNIIKSLAVQHTNKDMILA